VKNIILALTVVGFLVGCGGGGDNPSSDDSGNGGSPEGDQNSHSQSLIDSLNIDNFASEMMPIDQPYELSPILIRYINNMQGLVALEIAKNAGAVRSHCEKGITGELGLVHDSDFSSPKHGSGSGSFTFVASSGVMFEYVAQPDETCSYSDFFDGYISYDVDILNGDNHTEISSNMSATLGSLNGPFLINLTTGGHLQGATGYRGDFQSKSDATTLEISLSFMEMFTVKTDISEPYAIGTYEKIDHIYYKNYLYKSTSTGEGSEESTTISQSHEAEFEYKNRSYKLLFSGNTLTQQGGSISKIVGNFELQDISEPTKTAKGTTTLDRNADGIQYTYTFTKDGKTETKTIP